MFIIHQEINPHGLSFKRFDNRTNSLKQPSSQFFSFRKHSEHFRSERTAEGLVRAPHRRHGRAQRPFEAAEHRAGSEDQLTRQKMLPASDEVLISAINERYRSASVLSRLDGIRDRRIWASPTAPATSPADQHGRPRAPRRTRTYCRAARRSPRPACRQAGLPAARS